MQKEIKSEWITYEEAQHLVGLGRTTLWRLVSSGEIEAARVGRAVRLNRTSLTAYMNRSAQGNRMSQASDLECYGSDRAERQSDALERRQVEVEKLAGVASVGIRPVTHTKEEDPGA